MFLNYTLSIKSHDQRLWPGKGSKEILKQNLLRLLINMDIIKVKQILSHTIYFLAKIICTCVVSCSLFIHVSKIRLTLCFRKEKTFIDLIYFIDLHFITSSPQPFSTTHKIRFCPCWIKRTVSEVSQERDYFIPCMSKKQKHNNRSWFQYTSRS